MGHTNDHSTAEAKAGGLHTGGQPGLETMLKEKERRRREEGRRGRRKRRRRRRRRRRKR